MADDSATGAVAARAAREQQFHDERFAAEDDRPAGRFYELVGPSEARYHELLRGIPSGARALELGIGAEMFAWELLERGVDATAIDISAVAIEAAAEEARGRGVDPSRFVQMNAEELRFDDDSFDVVYGDAILHHLDFDLALPEIARVLRPDGRLIASEPTGHNPIINLYRRVTPDQRTEDEHPLVVGDVELLRRHFAEVEVEYFHFTSLAALALLRTRAFHSAADRLEALDRRLFHRFPALQRFGWMVVIDARGPRPAAG